LPFLFIFGGAVGGAAWRRPLGCIAEGRNDTTIALKNRPNRVIAPGGVTEGYIGGEPGPRKTGPGGTGSLVNGVFTVSRWGDVAPVGAAIIGFDAGVAGLEAPAPPGSTWNGSTVSADAPADDTVTP
jgi:hypothetical protein